MPDHHFEKFKRFGRTYGRYDGAIPVLVTKDPELVKSVLVKNFDNFDIIIDLPVSQLELTIKR